MGNTREEGKEKRSKRDAKVYIHIHKEIAERDTRVLHGTRNSIMDFLAISSKFYSLYLKDNPLSACVYVHEYCAFLTCAFTRRPYRAYRH